MHRRKSIAGPNGPIPGSRSTRRTGVKSGRLPAPVEPGQLSARREARTRKLLTVVSLFAGARGSSLGYRLAIAPGELDWLDASPPCQSFSTAGPGIVDA
jgi:hypothetical protein